MACKLYYKNGNQTVQVGTFPNRRKAEAFWGLVRPRLESKYGTTLEPIYVDIKGRG